VKFIIESDIFQRFPDLRIGVVLSRGLRIRERSKELENIFESKWKKLLEQMESKKQEVTDFKNIKSWRETYRQMGLNHKKYIPAVESLMQRLSKGHSVPPINTAVNAYLAVELLTMLPIGGYDLAVVDGDIRLRISGGGEQFTPLGGRIAKFTEPGEIVYSDGKTILTRHWNFRDSEHCKITEKSTEIILASEAALKDISTHDLIETLYQIVEYESTFCQGVYSTFILDKLNPEVEIH
jgi:DNA/RNA-binding domain of Phe-tRNA-synthetase-like protein